MTSSESLEWRLARVAHENWCERMIAEGWSPGEVFDPDAHIHDALVPFDHLNPVDRRSAYFGIVAADCTDEIRKAIDYARGRDQELGTHDMVKGLRVVHADAPEQRGVVVGWAEDRVFPGTLSTITVQWDSGETIEYAAAEREIVRHSMRT